MANTLHQLKRATEIVERYRARGNVFPRELRDCGRGDPVSQQEYRDACKVKTWKYSLLGKNIYNCSDEVRDYLDENMPGWCDRVYSHKGQSSSVQMKKAVDIVARYRERGNVLPRRLKDPTKAQETKDAINISTWKSSLKGYNRVTCSKELCSYLDENMPGWRQDHHKSKPRSQEGKRRAELAALAGTSATDELENKRLRTAQELMTTARGIVERYYANNKQYPSLKLVCRRDPNRAQEYSDAKKLHSWKSHIDKSIAPNVFEYLDAHMPAWKNSHVVPSDKNIPVSKAREIFRRCSMRNGAMPQLHTGRESDPVKILEHKDAIRLREWRLAYVQNPNEFCSVLKQFLDDKISQWRFVDITSPLPSDWKTAQAKSIAFAALNGRNLHGKNLNGRKRDVSPFGLTGFDGYRSGSMSPVVSTDGEMSSDYSSCGSDDGFTDDDSHHQASKRARVSPPNGPIDSEDFAGITALLQLSSSSKPSATTTTTVNSPAPAASPVPSQFQKSAPAGMPMSPMQTFPMQPVPLPLPMPMQFPSYSTYGNGNSPRPKNSLYAAVSAFSATPPPPPVASAKRLVHLSELAYR